MCLHNASFPSSRDRQFASWPDVQKLDNLYSEPSHSSRILLSSTFLLDNYENGFKVRAKLFLIFSQTSLPLTFLINERRKQAGTWYIQGGFFGGTKVILSWMFDVLLKHRCDKPFLLHSRRLERSPEGASLYPLMVCKRPF